MKIAIRGAPALLVLVLSSLGCAPTTGREPRDARALREAPLDTPLRSILGSRAVAPVAPAQDRTSSAWPGSTSFHPVVAPDTHLARRARR